MPSLISDSKTPSFSPIPAPDQTDHSSATHRHCGLPCSINWACSCLVISVSQSLAVA